MDPATGIRELAARIREEELLLLHLARLPALRTDHGATARPGACPMHGHLSLRGRSRRHRSRNVLRYERFYTTVHISNLIKREIAKSTVIGSITYDLPSLYLATDDPVVGVCLCKALVQRTDVVALLDW